MSNEQAVIHRASGSAPEVSETLTYNSASNNYLISHARYLLALMYPALLPWPS